MYGTEAMPWHGNVYNKPDPSRCCKFTVNTETVYFCNYFARNDVRQQKILTSSASEYVNNIWVARLNLKLHLFNLSKVQKTFTSSVKANALIDCNNALMDPIKYEIRLRVIYMRLFSIF